MHTLTHLPQYLLLESDRFPRGGRRASGGSDLGNTEPGVPEMRVVLEEDPLLEQSLVQTQLVLDVLLAPALDDHVAFLQVADEVSDHVDHLVLGAFVHQVGLGQDSWEPEPLD